MQVVASTLHLIAETLYLFIAKPVKAGGIICTQISTKNIFFRLKCGFAKKQVFCLNAFQQLVYKRKIEIFLAQFY